MARVAKRKPLALSESHDDPDYYREAIRAENASRANLHAVAQTGDLEAFRVAYAEADDVARAFSIANARMWRDWHRAHPEVSSSPIF